MDLLKGTIIWFATTGLVMFFSLREAMDSPRFFKTFALRTIEIPVVLQFVANLFPLRLWIEIPLQALLLVLAVLTVLPNATNEPKLRPVSRASGCLLAVAGLALLLASVVQLWHLWRELSLVGLLKEFVLPVWLTVGLMPFMYALSLVSAYGSAFRQIDMRAKDRRHALRARIGLLLSAGVNVYRLRGVGMAAYAMAHAGSLREAVEAFDRSRRRRERLQDADRIEMLRLARYAGVKELDARGLQLDRREFAETMVALEYLADCHMGHYRKRGGRYRKDLLELLGDSFAMKGLPKPHGIHMVVSADGKGWYAWRTTPSGWVLGIGADGPPPSQWKYDAAKAPGGPPTATSPGWLNALVPSERSTHWALTRGSGNVPSLPPGL